MQQQGHSCGRDLVFGFLPPAVLQSINELGNWKVIIACLCVRTHQPATSRASSVCLCCCQQDYRAVCSYSMHCTLSSPHALLSDLTDKVQCHRAGPAQPRTPRPGRGRGSATAAATVCCLCAAAAGRPQLQGCHRRPGCAGRRSKQPGLSPAAAHRVSHLSRRKAASNKPVMCCCTRQACSSTCSPSSDRHQTR